MLRLAKSPLLWLHIVVLVILFFFFGKYLLHPNTYVFNQWGDGIKNYFTPAWYIEYDNGVHFSGMNYPFGDHVVYTDNQPALSLVLNWIDDHIFPLAQYTVGIINTLMLLSFWLCAYLLYRILRHYNIPAWPAMLCAVIITCLNPQADRITAHYALSYCFYIPLLWWLHIRAQQKNYTILHTGLLIVVVFFFGFIHLYYLLLSALFFVTYTLVLLIKEKKFTREIICNIFICAVPVILVFGLMHLTDKITDRPATPYGFFTYKASLQSVFLPRGGWFTAFLQNKLHMRPANYEGYAYIGFAGTLTAIISLVLYIKKSRKAHTLRTQILPVPGNLSVYVMAAILSLLFSMTVPFNLGLQKLLYALPLIKQFRSPGRFAWIFYFIFLVYTVVFLYKVYINLRINKKITAITFIAIVFCISLLEANTMLNNQKRILDHNSSRNPLALTNTFWTSVLTSNGYSFSDFQSILFVPYFLNGSEKFYIDRSGYDSGKAMEIAYQTGLPLIDGMMSRTSVSQTLQLAQLDGSSLLKKDIIKKLSDKKILLITNEKELTGSEKYLISRSAFIGQQAHLKFYAMPVEALDDTQNILQDYFRSNKDSLYYSESAQFYAEQPLQLFYRNDLDDRTSDEPFMGAGSLNTDKKVIVAEIPVQVQDTIWAELSCWVKAYTETTAFPTLNADLLDANGERLHQYAANAKFSSDVQGHWVRASENFPIPPACVRIRLETNDSRLINMDNILLRHTAFDAFYGLNDDGSFRFNNYPIGN